MITTKDRNLANKAQAAFDKFMQAKLTAEKGGLEVEPCFEQGTIEVLKPYRPHLDPAFTKPRRERIVMG